MIKEANAAQKDKEALNKQALLQAQVQHKMALTEHKHDMKAKEKEKQTEQCNKCLFAASQLPVVAWTWASLTMAC